MKGATMRVVRIGNCARCNGDHDGIEIKRFTGPSPYYDGWALCPTSGEPILFLETPEEAADDPEAYRDEMIQRVERETENRRADNPRNGKVSPA